MSARRPPRLPEQHQSARDAGGPQQQASQKGAYGARIEQLFQDAIRDLADLRQPPGGKRARE